MFSEIYKIAQAVIVVSAGLTAYRLYRTGLYRRYAVLFPYMAFLALYSLVPLVLNMSGPVYFWVWMSAQPVQWMLEILLVRELCRIILEKYPGVSSLGRWLMYLGVAAAAFVSFLSLLPHITSTMPTRSRVLGYWVAADRGVTLSLVIFLLLMLFAVSRYPVRLNRNVVMNAVLFTLCFMCDSLASILKTVFDLRINPSVSIATTAIEAGCLLVWVFFLTPKGETTHLDWIHFGQEYEDRVLAQLDALNNVLQRAS